MLLLMGARDESDFNTPYKNANARPGMGRP